MIIHVVQQGDTIQSIAQHYETSVPVLIQDNALSEPNNLVVGQSIVVAHPSLTYTVQEGDTLIDIANSHNVTMMQLYQNNPYLNDSDYIYPGDIIVISYDKKGTIATHGNAVPYINQDTLIKTLPYLTYLSIVNYTATENGDIISYYDDVGLIQMAKKYNVIPLMFLSTSTLQGEANIRTAYELLLNEESINKLYVNIVTILREKKFYGLNMSFEYISPSNLPYIEKASAILATRLKEDGFLAFGIINPEITVVGDEIQFQRVDLTQLGALADGVVYMNYQFATNINPPSPVSSINNIEAYIDYLLGYVPPDKLSVGLATIGYDWALPFIPGISSVNSLTIDSAVALARNEGAVIQFDEVSQTPYYLYTNNQGPYTVDHIVWFVDARSINALLELIEANDLYGTAIWSITVFNKQLWLIINSQYEIVKFELEQP